MPAALETSDTEEPMTLKLMHRQRVDAEVAAVAAADVTMAVMGIIMVGGVMVAKDTMPVMLRMDATVMRRTRKQSALPTEAGAKSALPNAVQECVKAITVQSQKATRNHAQKKSTTSCGTICTFPKRKQPESSATSFKRTPHWIPQKAATTVMR